MKFFQHIALLHSFFSALVLTQFVEVHAVRLRTRLVLHKMRTILGRPQRGLESPAVDVDVVDHLDCTQSVVRPVVGHISTRTGALETKQGHCKTCSFEDFLSGLKIFFTSKTFDQRDKLPYTTNSMPVVEC